MTRPTAQREGALSCAVRDAAAVATDAAGGWPPVSISLSPPGVKHRAELAVAEIGATPQQFARASAPRRLSPFWCREGRVPRG